MNKKIIPKSFCYAFYKAKYGTLFSKIIAFWTFGDYSHTEVVFSKACTDWYYDHITPEERINLIETSIDQMRSHKIEELRLSFSASERDKCVRFKLIYFNPSHWDFILAKFRDTYPPTLAQEILIIEYCKDMEGAGYDYLGLGSFILQKIRLIKPDPEKYWCSETTERVAYYCRDLTCTQNEPPSPSKLYKLIT